jgi:hypothetical protein
MRGFEALDDARKWRFYTYIFDEQVPPPWETVRRCDEHETFTLALGQNWLDVRPHAGGVEITTASGPQEFDAVIFGTGFDVDLLDRPEIARYTPHVDTWARHVDAPQAAANPEPARFPYLGPGFELRSATGEHEQALSRLHLFNWGSTMSHGALAGDIPGLHVGATRVAQAIARDLFLEDADAHWARCRRTTSRSCSIRGGMCRRKAVSQRSRCPELVEGLARASTSSARTVWTLRDGAF